MKVPTQGLKMRLSKKKTMMTSSGQEGKCKWSEATDFYKEFCQCVQQDAIRALICQGPYRLSSEKEYLQIEPRMWMQLTPTEKIAKVKQLYPFISTWNTESNDKFPNRTIHPHGSNSPKSAKYIHRR